MLEGKKIVLGITGSIAAYKAAYLCRAFIKKGAEVQVVITPAGKEFITPVTLSALTQKPTVSDFFTANDGTWHSHVDLGLWADAMVIAPATASTIGKMANGIADNMLITTYLSMKAPVFVAPAMDLDMYAHPSTQHNLEKLKLYGNHIIEPATGFLASTLEGKGRMEEPDTIVQVLDNFFEKQTEFSKKKILITAGPTYEKIDPVRYISNYSSGKMGYALAEEFANRGADVLLISGPVKLDVKNPKIKKIAVISAEEMYQEAVAHFPGMDAGILCAAVADYKPAHYSGQKMKRKENEGLTLDLTPNPDIAAELGKIKSEKQVLAGFALETDNELSNAEKKLKKKNLDLIVLNSLQDKGAGFQGDTNKIMILNAKGNVEDFPLKPKREVAKDIANVVGRYFGFLLLFFMLSFSSLQAQELNAKVSVNSDRIQGTNRNIFSSLERALNQFINGTQWSSANFATNEQIDCSFALTITEQLSETSFKAELFVQSRRPVYNSSYTTTMLNFRDTHFSFEYMENGIIEMQQNTLNSNLEAVIAFYANLILALDFDSFSPKGGSVFYRQAQNISNLAQSNSTWDGWSAFNDVRNRGSIINTFLDEGMSGYRDLWYIYHRKGLDEMAANPDRGRITLLNALPVLKDIRQVRSSEVIMQMFADSKLDEIVSIAGKATPEEKKELYTLLRNLYPSFSNQLEPLKK
ncbi:hypothetical protein AGMMS50262_07160 [Bacteroidia bacterium]|nr:hypothetical protein AGMMS50262_07160 [Bacteroidia bacterium]